MTYQQYINNLNKHIGRYERQYNRAITREDFLLAEQLEGVLDALYSDLNEIEDKEYGELGLNGYLQGVK